MTPRWRPRWRQEGLDRPRWGQDGAKMEPIWAKMGPDRTKMAPRWAVMEIKIDAKMPSLVDLIF